MRVGSDAHKELFCRTLLDGHVPYEPAELEWPDLDEEHLDRLRGIPFWDQAYKDEYEAGRMLAACAETITDPLIRDAVSLQAEEEARHGRLIQHMIDRYDIPVEKTAPDKIPADVQEAFIDFGYNECLDSFGAYGLFECAREAEFMPPAFFRIFDQVLREESQHCVFFVNWVAHHLAGRGRGDRWSRGLRAGQGYWRALRKILEMALGVDDDDAPQEFATTAGRTFVDDLTPHRFLRICLEQNERRLAGFDRRLLVPRVIPGLARTGAAALRVVPERFFGARGAA